MIRYRAAWATLVVVVACGVEAAAATTIPARPAEVVQALHDGLAAFARRAEGTTGTVGHCAPVDEALGSRRRAHVAAPDGLEVVAALLRALQFRGSFCAATREEKKVLFDQGRQRGQAAVDRLEAQAGKDPQRRLEHLRRVPHAGLVYIWTAALWGEGLALLRESYALGPEHPVTRVFLAEAILAHEPQHKAEAIALLEAVVATPPRPDLRVEDRGFAERARTRLALVKP
ncbi:MAG: hypothetical protein NDJ94_18575 [Vicinamibacteria bacterium]|nr:hypothetical protein [Vicinamibacteria bacterium]